MLYAPTQTGSNIKGLLLVWHNNNWGTVCDDVTDCDDPVGGGTANCNGNNVNVAGGKNLAAVVCRALGNTGGDEYNTDGASSGYPIVVDGTENHITGCAGTEARLSECPWLRFGHHNCGHHEDVGVTCVGTSSSPSPPPVLISTSLRCSPEGCDRCEGDCDSDSECKAGLHCFQRNAWESLPGCSGDGLRAWDYCTPYRSVPVYTLMNEELSWSDANADCLAAGLHLASVHSAAENALLVTAAAGNSVWIGGTDAASEGTWGWSPINTPLRYTNWISGEPNNDWGNEDCMQVRLSGKWNDAHCYFKLKYVCERRAWTPAPVVDVFLDPNCAGKRRRITSADFLHSYAACGGTWDDGSTMALQPARKTWWGSFKVAAGYAVDTYGTCHGGSRREVGVTSAAGCVSPTYDFNHVKISLPPSPP